MATKEEINIVFGSHLNKIINIGSVCCRRGVEAPQTPNASEKWHYEPELPLESQLMEIGDEYWDQHSTWNSRREGELSGSGSLALDCPPPPPPKVKWVPNPGDSQGINGLSRYLKTLYIELALKETIIPYHNLNPVAPGVLCASNFEPELRLHNLSHGLNEFLSLDELLMPIQTKEGSFLEPPRLVFIETSKWMSSFSLALGILHSWSRVPLWPQRGHPIVLALFIPLNELKGTLLNYISKEILPKERSFGRFTSVRNILESLKSKLLFVIDTYDSQLSKDFRKKSQDVLELLEGRLFPESRIIIISHNSSDFVPTNPKLFRHLKYEGLTWRRSLSLLESMGASSRLLDIAQNAAQLRNILRTPLGCLSVASTYEMEGAISNNEIDIIESILQIHGIAPNSHYVVELGRLTLFLLKTNRNYFTSADLRIFCSSPESIINCFEKSPLFGKTAKKKGDYYYTPICDGICEYLAAKFLVSMTNIPGLLASEISEFSQLKPLGDDIDAEMLKILTYSMNLLQGDAHILLSKLTPLWLSPTTIFSLCLAAQSESEANLNALSDILGISKAPPNVTVGMETKPIWVSIRSSPEVSIRGWSLALKSSICALKNLELIYQIEKNMLLELRNCMDVFLESLARNKSIQTIRITSLIENDADINHLGKCISRALLKPNLENFELILTLLEEEPSRLQSVITELCKAIPKQGKLTSIFLDLGSISTSQLIQICAALEKSPHIRNVRLPHLRYEKGVISAIAALISENKPLSFISLPSCWGVRDDLPSSSGVSMGSSGSSSGNSCLIKQDKTGSLTASSKISSLPRSISSQIMGKSTTLPRQLLEGTFDKRSQDSVIFRQTWYPTPGCDGQHNSGTLHDLLAAAREPYSRLHGLDLSKAQLTLEDSMCLGETVRLSQSLQILRLEGCSRLSEVLPSVLASGESSSLKMLCLGSPRLILEDPAVAMSARAFASCIRLMLLSLNGWTFKIDDLQTLAHIRSFLSLTSIREIELNSTKVHLSILKSDVSMRNDAYECRSVVVLKMAGAQVMLGGPKGVTILGPQLLPYLTGFPYLRELDLSAPARSGMGGSTSSSFVLDDKSLITFFQQINQKFRNLNTLKICHWNVCLSNQKKTFDDLKTILKSSALSHVTVDGINIVFGPKKIRSESKFLHIIISTLPFLRWIGISLLGINEDQIKFIGNAIRDMKSNEIDIRLSDSSIENARLLTQSLSLDDNFDICVREFTSSSNLLIHVEKNRSGRSH